MRTAPTRPAKTRTTTLVSTLTVAAAVAAAVALGGCEGGGSASRTDAGGDAAASDGSGGSRLDAARPDATRADATGTDATPGDSGSRDATRADAAPADAASSDAAPPDAAPADPADLGPPPSIEDCFGRLLDGFTIDYAQFNPQIGRHCAGTAHQRIEGVERLVFLGDSVTKGTPPARPAQYYRTLLGNLQKARFGEDLEIIDCSAFGARTDDLLIGQQQIPRCGLAELPQKRTLFVFTIGGNDISAWAQRQLSADEALVQAAAASQLLDDAVAYLKDPANFPAGSYVVFANPYEYTDATGDLESCRLAAAAGLSGNWIEGAPAVLAFQEQFMGVAVAYQADLVFSLEHFCGHGYRREDPNGQCYRGPDAELWFDPTCIHPSIAGHEALANLFDQVIGGD